MKLRVTPPDGESFDYTVDKDLVVVGRSSTADIPLVSDPYLSRHHARIMRRDNGLMIEDLGSRNGTFVNDKPVEEPTEIKPGDLIRLSASAIAVSGERASIESAITRDTDIGQTIFRPASELLEEEVSSSTDLLDSAEALRKYAQRLEILRDVHEAVATSLSEDELLSLILDRTFDHLKPEQGVVYMREEDGEYYQATTRAVPGQSTDIPLSRTLFQEVLGKGMAALVFDASTDERFSASESIMMSGIRSIVATPILDVDAGAMGMIVLNSKVARRRFSEEDMELLTSLASVAALKIRNIALTNEAVQRRVLEAEVAAARQIQLSLIPEELPSFAGYAIEGRNIPSRGVSGDYYEVLSRSEDRECVLFMADVSGKGMAASILTASLEALAAEPIEAGDPTDEICAKLCRRLAKRTPPAKYATAFVAVLEHETGRLSYTNAGHNTALLVHPNGSIEELGPCGLPIAILPEAEYERRETRLEPGATLVIYTDGITEAENESEEEYGFERLRDCVARNFRLSPEDLADVIEDDVAEFVDEVPYADDRTMVIVQRAG